MVNRIVVHVTRVRRGGKAQHKRDETKFCRLIFVKGLKAKLPNHL